MNAISILIIALAGAISAYARWRFESGDTNPMGETAPGVAGYEAPILPIAGYALHSPYEDTFLMTFVSCNDAMTERVIVIGVSEDVLPLDAMQDVKWRFDSGVPVSVRMMMPNGRNTLIVGEKPAGLPDLASSFRVLYSKMSRHELGDS